jgi:hypothetical protein
MCFCEERHIEGTPSSGNMIKTQLIAENRLTGSRLPLNYGNSTPEKSALQYDVETFDPASHLFQAWTVA